MVRTRPGKLDRVTDNPYRGLPSVDALADRIGGSVPRAIAVDVSRSAIEQARSDLADGRGADPEANARRVVRAIERSAGVPIVNASGVLLHTNLGRSPWPTRAVERASAAASGYTNLEMDVDTGERGRRGGYVERLLKSLTGAEAGFVVNNNAAALLLSLGATSAHRAVPVSRGELIEIGGAFRLPDVMEAGGARLVEVGTTNRTRLGDYQTAIQTHDCGAILKVHPSNYGIEGFTQEATAAELADLATANGLPFIYDIGSGLLDAEASWLPAWLRDEPAARQSLDQGADLVTFSGDKLLGGPQAGIMVGAGDVITAVKSHPLARAMRADAVTYAALAATLEIYLEGSVDEIPFWRYALLEETDLETRCHALADAVGGVVEPGDSKVGAGSAPRISIPTLLVRLESRQDLYECLLSLDRPILTRRAAGDLIVDLRAVDPGDDAVVAAGIDKCR